MELELCELIDVRYPTILDFPVRTNASMPSIPKDTQKHVALPDVDCCRSAIEGIQVKIHVWQKSQASIIT